MESIEHQDQYPTGNPGGQKQSPFANSPYQTPFQSSPSGGQKEAQTVPGFTFPGNEAKPRAPKAPKTPRPPKNAGFGKKLLAVLAALAVVAGSCCVTAGLVNSHWENRTNEMQADFEQQLGLLRSEMESRLSAVQSTGGTGSSGGSGLSVGTTLGLTPSQVYAQNVDSVVSVSNYTGSMLSGTGSGFIITADGYVMTNYHVIEDATRLTITTYMGQEYDASVVGYDEMNDVALLKVDANGLQHVTVGSSSDLLVGDMVVAIGNPLGDELASTMTVGYVSGKDRSISTDGTIINMLQTDAAINSGNSGGPLFNMKGEVIGITSAKYSGSSASGASIEGIGFAIPIDDVMGMIDDFMNYGYLRNQAYLGVSVLDLDTHTAKMYSLPEGSYVQSVVAGGSADRAGVLPQDIIIALGDYTISGNTSLTTTLRQFSAGDTTTITVYRSGAEVVLDITFDERPQDVNADASQPTEPGEMPQDGSYEEWYEFFSRYFGIED